MNKKYCNVSECVPGQIIAEDIYNDSGILIIPKNAVVDENLIEKLNNLGIIRIQVLEDAFIDPNLLEIKRDYSKNVSEVKEVLNDIVTGKELDYEKVNQISNSVYSQVTSNFGIINCISSIRDADQYTYTHSVNVSLYSMLIGKWLGLSDEDIKNLIEGGLLHDVGKAKIPSELLNKRGKLTPEEFEIIKRHVIYSYEICKNIEGLDPEVKKAILMHHERENGSGYPYGIKGKDMNLYAKIIAIADVYDAITSNRVYRKRKNPFETFKEFEEVGIGSGNFDIKILLTFLSNIATYYTGSKVLLNTGDTGEIVYIAPHCISSPVVRVGERFIDLYTNKDYSIVEIL